MVRISREVLYRWPMTAATKSSIATDTKEIKALQRESNGKLGTLWADRSIWNWVIRVFVLGTPVVAIAANYFTRS